MTTRRERDFALRKALDLVTDHVDTSVPPYKLLDRAASTTAHRSSDAFNSSTPSLYASPSRA